MFECSGSANALDQAIASLKKRGALIEVALFKVGAISLSNINTMVNNEIQIRGSYGHRYPNWDRILNLMSSQKVNLLPLITHKFSLKDWEKGFSIAENMKGIKVLLQP